MRRAEGCLRTGCPSTDQGKLTCGLKIFLLEALPLGNLDRSSVRLSDGLSIQGALQDWGVWRLDQISKAEEILGPRLDILVAVALDSDRAGPWLVISVLPEVVMVREIS